MNTVDAPTPALQINLLSNRSRCEALGRLRCGELLGGVLATAILCVSVRVLVSGVALMVEDSSPQSVKVEDEITQLQIELAALLDARLLVATTYELEGDRLEILLAHSRIETLRSFGRTLGQPRVLRNVEAVLRSSIPLVPR
jgi:hypothetical protein